MTGSWWVPSPRAMNEDWKPWPSMVPDTLTRPRVPKNSALQVPSFVQGSTGRVGVSVERSDGSGHLDVDRGDGVGDDVVELSSHPVLLVAHPLLSFALPFGLCVGQELATIPGGFSEGERYEWPEHLQHGRPTSGSDRVVAGETEDA